MWVGNFLKIVKQTTVQNCSLKQSYRICICASSKYWKSSVSQYAELFNNNHTSKTLATPIDIEHFQKYLLLITYATKLVGENVRFQRLKNKDHTNRHITQFLKYKRHQLNNRKLEVTQ